MSQSTPSTRAPHQLIALTIGVVYLLVGAAGFFVTGFDGFAEHNHDQTLLGFAVNPLHNIVHILIGLLGLAMWSVSGRARTFGWLLVAGYGATFVFGLFAVNNPDINILNINAADNVLHIGSVVIGLAIALWPQRQASTASPELERF
ncbi:DUF4383 domain-containing protein [Promicromonospora iranensis]|uniref:Uncharacterized membrane protein YuzA (DUF378 family) n=1 Tax=Promicromonospora iranensis TaxID=1105144 RepID=A0ABU2CV55_9MICO|nr:DUF4383 domain-containing protein [Promicromonospora iranensis]MDR7385022.1 uncharacterized membrane protein YuzA (DUF378 family) [Promicromonospora iranensis]